MNADWKREAGWQAAQDLHNFRKVRRLKGACVAARGVCRRADQKRDAVEILLNICIRQLTLTLRSVHTRLPLCYSLERLLYL